VVAAVAGAGPITACTLPGGPAISTWHTGPHDQLGAAYGRLGAWQAEQNRASAGPGWEVYHWLDPRQPGDPVMDPDFTTWHTQLVQPIQ
jgi:effector-binding domain-containing protein